MTLEFYQTVMGKEFYDRTMPRIAKALERIAAQLEEDAKERHVTEEAKPTEHEGVFDHYGCR